MCRTAKGDFSSGPTDLICKTDKVKADTVCLYPPLSGTLLSQLKGFAVGALIHRRVALVGSHGDAVERAVILALAVVHALLHGAFDAMVRMTGIHIFRPSVSS